VGVTWVDPTDVTPDTVGSWTDVDVSATCPAGTTGVFLRVVNNSATGTYYIGWRKNGSTDNRTTYIQAGYSTTAHHSGAVIGVDANRVFEFYRGNAALGVYLVGYIDNDGTFATNATNVTPANNSAWTDVDVGQTCVAACLEYNGENVNVAMGARCNGSTDARTTASGYHGGIVVGTASNVCEVYTANNTYREFWLVGYITAGVTMNTNGVDRSLGTTGAYADITLSTGATGGFIEFSGNVDYWNEAFAIRPNGSSFDLFASGYARGWFPTGADVNGVIEGKLTITNQDFYELGITTAEAGGSSLPAIMAHYRRLRSA
jgi:hypothetical protein